MKEANPAIEDEINKCEVKKNKEDSSGSRKRGRGDVKEDDQFKQPYGAQPDNILSEYTPLMAQN